MAQAMAAAEAHQCNLVVNRYNRVMRIQKLYYHLLPSWSRACLPVPPSCILPTTRLRWDQDYQVWRDAVILLAHSAEPDPQHRPTITQAKEYRRHASSWDSNVAELGSDRRTRIALTAAIANATEKPYCDEATMKREASEEATEKAYCDEEMAKTTAKKEERQDIVAKLWTNQDTAKYAQFKKEIRASEAELAATAGKHEDYVVAKINLELGLLHLLRDYYTSKTEEPAHAGRSG